ncbi:MAG: hypothetical protein ACXWF1_00560 [Chthoniobacterales bacterium]
MRRTRSRDVTMHAALELSPFLGGILFALLCRGRGNFLGASFTIGFLCALCAGELAGSLASTLSAIALDSFMAAFAILTTRAVAKRLLA